MSSIGAKLPLLTVEQMNEGREKWHKHRRKQMRARDKLICKDYQQGLSITEISRRYEISRTTVYAAVKRGC